MPRKTTKKGLTKKLDKAWSRHVKIRAGNKCEVCGSSLNLNSHHIVSRTNRRLRWELYNGVCLCVKCHKFGNYSAHNNPVFFQAWLKQNRSDDHSLVESTMNEILKWGITDMQDKLLELENV
jgi:hypothetical protein